MSTHTDRVVPHWTNQFAEMLDNLAFPVRFPDDFEIICSCGDSMKSVEYEELVRTDTGILRWKTTNYECRNCRGCEAA